MTRHQSEERHGFPFDPVADRLFKSRTIIISGEITQKVAASVTANLLAMSNESLEPVTVYLNSQGGHVEAGDTMHDIMKFVAAPVRMVGTGWVASAGALIYVSVPRERRFCLPNTRFLLHQPWGGAGGSASDIEIEAREILRMRDRLNKLFAAATGQSLSKIEEDTHRNFWLDAHAAVKYGLVGKVISGAAELNGA